MPIFHNARFDVITCNGGECAECCGALRLLLPNLLERAHFKETESCATLVLHRMAILSRNAVCFMRVAGGVASNFGLPALDRHRTVPACGAAG